MIGGRRGGRRLDGESGIFVWDMRVWKRCGLHYVC